MKDGEKVEIDGVIYEYSKFYKRLQAIKKDKPIINEIRCPKCHQDEFSLSYCDYSIIAHCLCGHSMTVYDG